MKKLLLRIVLLLLVLALAGAGWFFVGVPVGERVSAQSSFGSVAALDAFSEYSDFIIPWKDTLNSIVMPHQTLRSVCAMNHYDTDTIVEGFNWTIDATETGGVRFYSYYTDEEKAADPTKEQTGLLWFPAEDADAPLAFVVPGGGLTVVCLFAEGFPSAELLHEADYNVAVLLYRVSECPDGVTQDEHILEQRVISNQDFGAALQYLFAEEETFSFDRENYSVWGFSAGGLLSQLWGLSNEYGYAACGLPQPTMTALAYSGWYDESYAASLDGEPPTFFSYTLSDTVIGDANVAAIADSIEAYQALGISVASHVYTGVDHGYGTGGGTVAEGWMDEAIAFWENCATEEAAEKTAEN